MIVNCDYFIGWILPIETVMLAKRTLTLPEW